MGKSVDHALADGGERRFFLRSELRQTPALTARSFPFGHRPPSSPAARACIEQCASPSFLLLCVLYRIFITGCVCVCVPVERQPIITDVDRPVPCRAAGDTVFVAIGVHAPRVVCADT